jgi:hypothetical protein
MRKGLLCLYYFFLLIFEVFYEDGERGPLCRSLEDLLLSKFCVVAIEYSLCVPIAIGYRSSPFFPPGPLKIDFQRILDLDGEQDSHG